TSFRASSNNCALAAWGALVYAFAVDSTTTTAIYINTSSDYGATWSGWSLLQTATGAVGYLAAAIKDTNTALLLYSVGATVYSKKRSGGTWGAAAAWTNSVASVTGLACLYSQDFNVAITGTDSLSDYKIWTTIYGDGYSQAANTWSALREVSRASAGSNVQFRAPFLAYPDVYRLTFVEKYTGSVAYSRPYLSFSPATADYVNNLWHEPVPFNLASQYGLAIAFSSTAAWLTTPAGVWQASLTTAALDVTADVLEAATETEPTGGRLRLVLRNDDGRYNNPGTGANAVIKPGGELRLSLGYRTASGPLVSAGPTYWIEGWEHTSDQGKATFVIHARDAWGLLEGWRSRRQYAWAQGEKSVFQLLSFLLARAGLESSSLGSTSSTLVNLYPSFTIHPSERGATAVQRLLAMVPDVIFFREHHAYIKYPQAGDASDYSYGTDHAVLRGHYNSDRRQANRVQVFGEGYFAESFQWSDIEAAYDRVRQVDDLNLNTAALAQDRADTELRRQDIAATSGEIVVPTNCGQELYDVISITDAPAGLAAAKRRLLGLGLRYSAGGGSPTYEQRLSLGAV
ncbi:MAG: hypothetical protein Q8O40_11365, partial [Chloroflexota bacterium]|nr:hypothetical protein [Chloroflexota bacterium]